MNLVDRCGALARAGLSDSAIAERLGIYLDTATKKRVLAGVRRTRPSITVQQEEIINRLADDGASMAEIARTAGVSWPSAAKRRPDAIWSSQDAAAWGALHRRIQSREMSDGNR